MEKLRLSPEELEVQSFTSQNRVEEPRGTVRAASGPTGDGVYECITEGGNACYSFNDCGDGNWSWYCGSFWGDTQIASAGC
jgi:hypothetical protein